jgi:hypothetical protein
MTVNYFSSMISQDELFRTMCIPLVRFGDPNCVVASGWKKVGDADLLRGDDQLRCGPGWCLLMGL